MTYKRRLGLFRNPAVRQEIHRLDPVKDHCRIVHLLTGYEFPWDGIRALEIALMRSFCSPSVSTLLQRTGEFHRHGQKRYDDTALLVAAFMEDGYDSVQGRAAIAQINKIHSPYSITNEDYLFVLSTFVLQPIDWIGRYGWRKCNENEKLALFYFFREVGIRMNLTNIPATLEGLVEFSSEYESQHFCYSAANNAVATATLDIVKEWLPFFAWPFVRPVISCFLDHNMLTALGFQKPAFWLKMLVMGIMRIRAGILRFICFTSYPRFFTKLPNRTLPDGYQISDLGPTKQMRKRVSSRIRKETK